MQCLFVSCWFSGQNSILARQRKSPLPPIKRPFAIKRTLEVSCVPKCAPSTRESMLKYRWATVQRRIDFHSCWTDPKKNSTVKSLGAANRLNFHTRSLRRRWFSSIKLMIVSPVIFMFFFCHRNEREPFEREAGRSTETMAIPCRWDNRGARPGNFIGKKWREDKTERPITSLADSENTEVVSVLNTPVGEPEPGKIVRSTKERSQHPAFLSPRARSGLAFVEGLGGLSSSRSDPIDEPSCDASAPLGTRHCFSQYELERYRRPSLTKINLTFGL